MKGNSVIETTDTGMTLKTIRANYKFFREDMVVYCQLHRKVKAPIPVLLYLLAIYGLANTVKFLGLKLCLQLETQLPLFKMEHVRFRLELDHSDGYTDTETPGDTRTRRLRLCAELQETLNVVYANYMDDSIHNLSSFEAKTAYLVSLGKILYPSTTNKALWKANTESHLRMLDTPFEEDDSIHRAILDEDKLAAGAQNRTLGGVLLAVFSDFDRYLGKSHDDDIT